jgi:hypothetical protein
VPQLSPPREVLPLGSFVVWTSMACSIAAPTMVQGIHLLSSTMGKLALNDRF